MGIIEGNQNVDLSIVRQHDQHARDLLHLLRHNRARHVEKMWKPESSAELSHISVKQKKLVHIDPEAGH